VDAGGNLYIADYYNNRIRKVTYQGATLVLSNLGSANSGAYTVVVSNPFGSVTSSVVNLVITTPLQITTPSLPNGTNNVAYSQALTASGGQPPYSWTNVSGALPPGLALATNGVISGVPTTNGTFDFTVKVTDTLGGTATQALALTVPSLPGVIWIQPTNSPVAVAVGSNVSFSVSVTGAGPFSYQWQLNGTNLPNGIISTVAGNGTGGYSGDGGAATNAELYYAYRVAVDDAGNLFISDTGNYRVRKVGTNGIISTVAGNGTGGYSGDGGAATNAGLYGPRNVAIDAAGNLFIADYGSERIRKVGTNGIITTVAGNGTIGYSGDGGAATNAEFYYPDDVAMDAMGNLFIADQGNNRIRKVGTNGIISTVAGNGIRGYSGDGSAAANAELNQPFAVTLDTTGDLFLSDWINNRVRKVGTNGIITTLAGNGTNGYSGDGGVATNAEMASADGLALDFTGNLFIADAGNNRIRRVGPSGVIMTVAGNSGYGYSGDGGAATSSTLYSPVGVAVDAAGNLFIADTYNNRIRKVVFQGPSLALNSVGVSNVGAYDVVVSNPYGSVTSSVVNLTFSVAVTPAPAHLIINGNSTARIFPTGLSPRWRAMDTLRLLRRRRRGDQCGIDIYPVGVAVDASGNLFIADEDNNASARWEPTGLSPRWRATGQRLLRRRRRGDQCGIELFPLAWRWTPPATCSLRIRATTSSARWEPTGSSPRWRATGITATPATAARRPMRNCISPRRGGGRLRQPVHCGLITAHPQGGNQRDYHHGGGQWTLWLLRRRRRGDQCGIELSHWRGGGCLRQPVHCGLATTSSARWEPTGLSPRWRAMDHLVRLLRRRRRGDQCGIERSHWRGGGRLRQPVHCGFG
jgi:hypothetical protein